MRPASVALYITEKSVSSQRHHQMECCPSRNLSITQEEMKRGYFEDFKDLKETQGRMFEPSDSLSAPSTSTQLPNIAVRPTVSTVVLLPGSFPARPQSDPTCLR